MNKKVSKPLNKIYKFYETIRARETRPTSFISRGKQIRLPRTPYRSLARSKRKPTWGPNERANGSYLSVRVRPPHCSTPVSIITARDDDDDDNCTEIRSDLPSKCSSTNPRKRNLPPPHSLPPFLVSLGCPAFEHILTLSPHSETGQVKTNSGGRASGPFSIRNSD